MDSGTTTASAVVGEVVAIGGAGIGVVTIAPRTVGLDAAPVGTAGVVPELD